MLMFKGYVKNETGMGLIRPYMSILFHFLNQDKY